MSISSLFERLGAPLANSRWSWGSVDSRKGRVFLRAWQDESVLVAGKRYVKLAHHLRYANEPENLGYRERVQQLDAARGGLQAYVIMCKAKDVKARPRTIESYNDKDVFQIGELIEIEGNEWGEIVDRIPIRNLS